MLKSLLKGLLCGISLNYSDYFSWYLILGEKNNKSPPEDKLLPHFQCWEEKLKHPKTKIFSTFSRKEKTKYTQRQSCYPFAVVGIMIAEDLLSRVELCLAVDY